MWWADLPAPVGSAPGFRRPVVIVQGNRFNRSRIATVVVVPLTRTLRLADLPGNVLLGDLVSQLGERQVAQILAGIDIVLGR